MKRTDDEMEHVGYDGENKEGVKVAGEKETQKLRRDILQWECKWCDTGMEEKYGR